MQLFGLWQNLPNHYLSCLIWNLTHKIRTLQVWWPWYPATHASIPEWLSLLSIHSAVASSGHITCTFSCRSIQTLLFILFQERVPIDKIWCHHQGDCGQRRNPYEPRVNKLASERAMTRISRLCSISDDSIKSTVHFLLDGFGRLRRSIYGLAQSPFAGGDGGGWEQHEDGGFLASRSVAECECSFEWETVYILFQKMRCEQFPASVSFSSLANIWKIRQVLWGDTLSTMPNRES